MTSGISSARSNRPIARTACRRISGSRLLIASRSGAISASLCARASSASNIRSPSDGWNASVASAASRRRTSSTITGSTPSVQPKIRASASRDRRDMKCAPQRWPPIPCRRRRAWASQIPYTTAASADPHAATISSRKPAIEVDTVGFEQLPRGLVVAFGLDALHFREHLARRRDETAGTSATT